MQINMKFKNLFYAFSAFLLILSLSGCGVKPVHDVEQHAVPSNIQSSDQVKDAIIKAGRVLGWDIKEQKPGLLVGTLFIRTHMAKINIPYSKDAYSLLYDSSVNLDYDAANNTIHHNYNGWITNLNKGIKLQLSLI